jgi:hypothetical protein
MSTRSRIAIENQDGTVTSVYCHFDGYVKGVGKTLFENYNRETTEQLVELGDLSQLNESTETTIAYARDRGEDLEKTIYIDVEELFEMNSRGGLDYVYCLTKDNIWLVNKTTSNQVNVLEVILEEEGA